MKMVQSIKRGLSGIVILMLLTASARAGVLISKCDLPEAWILRPMGDVKCSLASRDTDRGTVLDVSYRLPMPDLDKPWSSGIDLSLRNADFTLGEGDALSMEILWEGGDNPLKIEILDDKNEVRFAELTQLNKGSGWQTVVIPQDDFDPSAEKVLKGPPGRVKSLRIFTYYWWNSDPRHFMLGGLSVIKKEKNRNPVISVSQLGYRPDDRKRVVIKTEDKWKGKKQFSVIRMADAEAVYKGKLEPSTVAGWPGYFQSGDFTELRESGRYAVQVESGGRKFISEPFWIEKNVLDSRTMPLNLEFIKGLRTDDPVIFGYYEMGGYRDAGTMLARYLCTNTHMLYGLSRYVLAWNLPRGEAARIRYAIDELRFAAGSLIAWQKPDGSVISTIVRDPDLYAHNQFPEDNTYPWKTTEGGDISTYVAAMSAAASALAPYDKELADKAMKAAEKTYAYIETQRLPKRISAAGNFLWDAIELYKLTKKEQYLAKAKELAGKVIAAQFLDFTRVRDAQICGNFSNSPRSLDFTYQYKLIHDIGAYFGLIELYHFIEPSDPLYADVRFFLKTFSEQYLLGMSSLTPYGEIAEGLENDTGGFFRVSYFHPPTGRLGVKSHGLNCDHMAYGLMGVRLAKIFNEPKLADFAADQIQWVLGVNPLGISMMTGIGGRQGFSLEEYLNLPSKPGGVLNGIVGRDGIAPYWARHWVSGEYWVPHNAYYTPLVGELENARLSADIPKQPLSVSIDVPKKIDGMKNVAVSWTVKNTANEKIKTALYLRARGAYALDETAQVELNAGESKRFEKTLNPSQKRSPCLVSASTQDGVVAENYFLPEFPEYAAPKRDNLKKLKILSVNASSSQKDEKNVDSANAIDGQMYSRWSSDFSDPQWLAVDLGEKKSVGLVKLFWETACGESYELQFSDDAKDWKTVYSVDDEDGGTDEIDLKEGASARYVRVYMKRRGTQYGYSLYEIEIYGK
ncbi:MAG: discoidin domain-containing protein [Elusimicrobiota bacterium]